MTDENPRTKLSATLPSVPRFATATTSGMDRRLAIGLMLSNLAVMYHRPNLTPDQSEQLIDTFVGDLAAFSLDDIDAGCRHYRCDSKNSFFPTPGQLIAAIRAATFTTSPRTPSAKALPPPPMADGPPSMIDVALLATGQPNAAKHFLATGKLCRPYELDPQSSQRHRRGF